MRLDGIRCRHAENLMSDSDLLELDIWNCILKMSKSGVLNILVKLVSQITLGFRSEVVETTNMGQFGVASTIQGLDVYLGSDWSSRKRRFGKRERIGSRREVVLKYWSWMTDLLVQ